MAYYMAVYHGREATTGQGVEEMYARVTKDFLAWKPADGLTHHSLWVSLDNRTSFSLFETDDPNLLAQSVAYFAPVGTFEVIPVVSADDTIRNWVTAGLVPADAVPQS
jgi:hypothetical protein